ncbi:MAG: hypothetical protein HAW61_01700 [Candidatus Portiera sp.]|nr:hypothetical protein [Portiera sp.]
MENNIPLYKLLLGYPYLEAYPLLAGRAATRTDTANDSLSRKDILGRKISLEDKPLPIYYHDIDISDILSRYEYSNIKAASITGESDAIDNTDKAIKNGDISIWQEVKGAPSVHLHEDKAVIVKVKTLNFAKGINRDWLCLRRIKKITGNKIIVKTKNESEISTDTIRKDDIHGEVLFSFTPKLRIAPSDVPALISYSSI